MQENSSIQDILSRELRDYVTRVPFDNLAVLLSWLHAYDPENTTFDDAFSQWHPDSVELATQFGGTNCIGATKIFSERLEQHNIDYQVAISTSNRLPEGANYIEVPYQHVGLMVTTEDGMAYLVEPGLGLVVPVPANNASVEVANRIYRATATDDTAELSVIKPDGTRINFDFIYLDEGDTETLVQKPLLRATTSFKMDAFSADGEKRASLKIDVYSEQISYLVHGSTYSFGFDQLDQMLADESFMSFVRQIDHLDRDEMEKRIKQTVSRKHDVVDTWLEGIQRQYYLDHSDRLSPYENSWSELEKRGYFGGGVVICLVNERNEVMVYQVPEGKSKPKINRFAGQFNLFVETADYVNGSQSVSDLEDFRTNLERAFKEEIGIPVPDDFIYREVDYMPQIRARCVICRVNSQELDTVRDHARQRNERIGYEEIGAVEWLPADALDSRWLEPNAGGILKKIVDDNLIAIDRRTSRGM